ncbi:hypothetical protein Pmar_PMAR010882 [Perkinsus marinus ATCC 50983]|uniref:Uncharacterized protein n=1 Tax=Perkinsus marinus (strain ATCC 50983 / TXsc) TaxID=423536 RepID=C5LU87_PERM5|nr:hypothetical protein Pmar_PMAR010882 [Perkinsus marinus ATCC 50983]EEQ99620.1 hypothetical protein Pmar_PMAR010882 [Perkinsus marinus ATCC 50983]|eukprot:XP_002766903.1 hypothetical protein Pmar_PMAR010882 [Perkinsus marinus ATCC 50983]
MPQKPRATKMSLYDFQGEPKEELLPTRSIGLERQSVHRRRDDEPGRGDSEGTWRRGGEDGRSGSRERGDPDAGRGDLDDNWRGSARLRPSGSREGFGDRREGFGDRRVDPADEDKDWRAGPRPTLDRAGGSSRLPRADDSGLTPFRQQLRERAEAARARRQGDRSTERDGQDDESRSTSRGFASRGEPRSLSREDSDRANNDDNWRATAHTSTTLPWRRPGIAEEPRSSDAPMPSRRPGTAPASDWKAQFANRNRASGTSATEEPRTRAWVPPSRADALRDDRARHEEPVRRGDSFRRDDVSRRETGSWRAEALRRDEPLRREEPTRSSAPWRRGVDREEHQHGNRQEDKEMVESVTRELETMDARGDEWAVEEEEEKPTVPAFDAAKIDKFLVAYQKHVDDVTKKTEHIATKMPKNLGVAEMQSSYLLDKIVAALVMKASTLASLDECLSLFHRHAPVINALIDSNRQTRGYCFQLLTSSQKAVESVKCPRLAKDCTLVEAVWYSLYDIDAVTAELIAFWSDEYSGSEADTADRAKIVFQTQALREWLSAVEEGEATRDATEEDDDDEWASSSSSDDEDIEALIPKRATDIRVR